MQLQIVDNRQVWDDFVNQSPYGHPLQLWGWGELKELNNWQSVRLAVMSGDSIIAGAQVLTRVIPKVPRVFMYIPRGPVAEPESDELKFLLSSVVDYARDHGAISVKMEPNWTSCRLPKGWRKSQNRILLDSTLMIDLTLTEELLLQGMRSKTRQYIRKSEREGIEIVRDTNNEHIDRIMELYRETAHRADFALHEEEYYHRLCQTLGENNHIYVAKKNGQLLAFLWLVATDAVAFELYGGMSAEGSDLKANYALKWEVMKRMKSAGIHTYDLNGRLNEGIDQFKSGFVEEPTTLIGPYDYPIRLALYQAWERGLPIAKRVMRRVRRGKR